MKKIISYIKKRIKRLYCKHDRIVNTGHYMDTDERGSKLRITYGSVKSVTMNYGGGSNK